MLELNKLYCMDCIEGLKQLPDKSIDVAVTDPPYNADLNYGCDANGLKFSDCKPNYHYELWCKEWFNELNRVCKKFVIITIGTKNLGMWYRIKEPDYVMIWYRANSMTGTPFGGINAYEPILVYIVGNTKPNIPFDVLRFNVHIQSDVGNHPCPKQLDFWTELVKTFTEDNEIVLDPFMGSGTTAISCKNLNRRFIGFDRCPDYIKLAEKRLSQKNIFDY